MVRTIIAWTALAVAWFGFGFYMAVAIMTA